MKEQQVSKRSGGAEAANKLANCFYSSDTEPNQYGVFIRSILENPYLLFGIKNHCGAGYPFLVAQGYMFLLLLSINNLSFMA